MARRPDRGSHLSAFASAIVFGAVLEATEGSRIAVAVNLAYPIGDIVLLALVVAAIGLSGWRLTGTWVFAAGGCLVFAVTDSIYLMQIAAGTYSATGLMNLGWPVACLLLAFAAWQPARRVRTHAESWLGFGVCVAFALVAVGVLIYDHFDRVTLLAVILSAATLAVVLVRLALTFRENLALVAASREEALTDALTGLGNRRALLAEVEERLTEDFGENRLALVLLDLNGFKEYNDSFGHLAGDALLARLGVRLAEALPGGRAFRMGGDEFCGLVAALPAEAARIGALAGAALTDRGRGFDIDAAWGFVVAPDEAALPSRSSSWPTGGCICPRPRVRRSAGRAPACSCVRCRSVSAASASTLPRSRTSPSRSAGASCSTAMASRHCAAPRAARRRQDGHSRRDPCKPRPLDEQEWVFVRRHTITGEWILSGAPALARVARILRASHERRDGAGYPDGLAANAIPLESRIISVCDAYTAMVTTRPYRAELEAGAGAQFDPAVVEVAVAALVERHRVTAATAA
ncbi:MAG: diguanylate cyclase domain-containing protein [Gaiellaceae bacterium]